MIIHCLFEKVFLMLNFSTDFVSFLLKNYFVIVFKQNNLFRCSFQTKKIFSFFVINRKMFFFRLKTKNGKKIVNRFVNDTFKKFQNDRFKMFENDFFRLVFCIH